MPKIGDRVKCKRCGKVWEYEGCDNDLCALDHAHTVRPCKGPPGVADTTWELCPKCGTDEEVTFLKRHVQATPQELN